MHKNTAKFLLKVYTLQLFLIPFMSEYAIEILSLINTLFLLFIAVSNLLNDFKALYLVILGYAVLAFFDVFKFHILGYSINNISDQSYYITSLSIYISFVLFLFSYIIYTPKANQSTKKYSITYFSTSRFKIFILPLALLISLLLISFPFDSPIMLLVSFFPKSVVVILFFLFIYKKNYIYLIWFIVLFLLSFSEISRRVYITLFLILIPILFAYYYQHHHKVKTQYKFFMIMLFSLAFLYMNFLRSDYEFGEGYVKGDEVASTINYAMQFKGIDTYDNTAYVIENFPQKYEFYYGETYFAILVQLIPRSIWKDKPVSFGAPLGLLRKAGIRDFNVDIWRSAVNGHSYSPGFLGEAYVNFGYLGIIIISILFGFIAKIFDKKVFFKNLGKDMYLLPYFAFYGAFFLVLRGDLLMATYFSILFFIFLRTILSVCKVNKRYIL